MHITTGTAVNLADSLDAEAKRRFIHEKLSPAMYAFGEGSYYSESEYSLTEGEWQTRFWDQETYDKLLEIKNTWDPEHIFGCRHCIGDETPAGAVNDKTMPSWRRP